MYSSRLLSVCVLVLGLATLSCRRTVEQVPTVLALLPFENQSGQPDRDWLTRAVPAALYDQISADRSRRVILAGSKRDADLAGATQYLFGTITVRNNALQFDAIRQSALPFQLLQSLTSGPGGQTIALVGKLAPALSPQPAAPPTTNEEALHQYGVALTASTPADADTAFEKAVTSDPAFGAAWEAWIKARLARGDREGAQQVLASARPLLGRLSPSRRARLQLTGATLSGNAAEQVKALETLAAESPEDLQAQAELGQAYLNNRDYANAVRALKRAVQLNNKQVNLWNSLGYAQAYTGDLPGAKASLEKAAALAPGEPNPIDSLGEVHYLFGKFPEAARYFRQAFEKNKSFLNGATVEKAAYSYLMAGDRAQADECMSQYLQSRRTAQDALATLRDAQYKYITGQREAAHRTLIQQLGQPNGSELLNAFGHAQRSVWLTGEGKQAEAQNEAKAALASAARGAPAAQGAVAAAVYLSQDLPTPEAWKTRADQMFPQPQAAAFRQLALAYALLLHRHYAAAVPLWKEIDAKTNANPATRPNGPLYASALAGAGQLDAAREVLARYSVPSYQEDNLFQFLIFPRERELRSR